jgi:hypothetical protein
MEVDNLCTSPRLDIGSPARDGRYGEVLIALSEADALGWAARRSNVTATPELALPLGFGSASGLLESGTYRPP